MTAKTYELIQKKFPREFVGRLIKHTRYLPRLNWGAGRSHLSPSLQGIQFNDLESYVRIVAWMNSCDGTYTLGNKVRYTHPTMLLDTVMGTYLICPGDWVIKNDEGAFNVINGEEFSTRYQKVGVTLE